MMAVVTARDEEWRNAMTATTKSGELATSYFISLRQPWERAVWKQRYNCSLAALNEVISAVGRNVGDVEREFARRRAPLARVVGRPPKLRA
jgi:hypothetical protein